MKKVIYAMMMVLFIGLASSCTHEYEEIELEEIMTPTSTEDDGMPPAEDPVEDKGVKN
ncbi:MAG: hypothetical protein WBA74_00585 [Cyclobacteriaceae bacterium]